MESPTATRAGPPGSAMHSWCADGFPDGTRDQGCLTGRDRGGAPCIVAAWRPTGPRRAEDLQRETVRVLEGECRAVVGVDDPAVDDAEFLEPLLPGLEFLPVRRGEGDVVDPQPPG